MVWKGDGSARLAKSLITLIDQVDARFPERKRSSDGTLGDDRHRKTKSEHNPDRKGVVRALDISHDPAFGVDTYRIAETLRLGRDPRIMYVISNGRIFSSEVSPWQWRQYNGSNPHDMHMHVSVSADDALADDTRPWDITGAGGGGMVGQDPRLKLGDTGEAVKDAQKLLHIEVNGMFDPAMETAVRAFQATLGGLEVDGIIGPYTWRALRGEHPVQPTTRTTELSPQAIKAVSALADASTIARYRWDDRGVAPAGYIRGMAVTFALVCLKWKAGDSAARGMAAANTGDDSKDALSWYNSKFRALGMSNDVPGLDTLRHLFVLLMGLGMRESSGNCFEGRDASASNTASDTAEAGLFQQSYNSFKSSAELSRLLDAYEANPSWGFQSIFRAGVAGKPTSPVGSGEGAAFQRMCKLSPSFSVEAAAIGLRTLRTHWGPINRKEAEIRPDANALLQQVQQAVEIATAMTPPIPTPVPPLPPVPTPPPVVITAPPPITTPMPVDPIPTPPPIVVQAPQTTPQSAPTPPPMAPVPDPVTAALLQVIAILLQQRSMQPPAAPMPAPPIDQAALLQQAMILLRTVNPQAAPGTALTPEQQQAEQLRKQLEAATTSGVTAPASKEYSTATSSSSSKARPRRRKASADTKVGKIAGRRRKK